MANMCILYHQQELHLRILRGQLLRSTQPNMRSNYSYRVLILCERVGHKKDNYLDQRRHSMNIPSCRLHILSRLYPMRNLVDSCDPNLLVHNPANIQMLQQTMLYHRDTYIHHQNPIRLSNDISSRRQHLVQYILQSRGDRKFDTLRTHPRMCLLHSCNLHIHRPMFRFHSQLRNLSRRLSL